MEKEETKKKTSRKNKKKEEKSIGKIILVVIIVIASMIMGWLFASATENTYDVAFSVENGVESSVIKVEKNKKVLKPSDPTREGYEFVGWYLNGIKFDFDTAITEDITLTAIWSETKEENGLVTPEDPTTYVVTFDSNGGSTVVAQTIEENAVATEPTNPTRSGYTFAGWYNGDVKFDFASKITANITLTAKWTKVEQEEDKTTTTTSTNTVTKYTVKFDSNGGSKVSSKTVEKGKTVSKPSNPTRSGYTFLGWYLNGSKFDFSTKITKSITLTAKWQKKDVITWASVKVEGSLYPQVRIYIVKNGKYVAGTADVVNTEGVTTTRSIPASGWVTFADTVKTLKNIKVD